MYMTAQGGVRQDFLHVRAYNIMHTLTYTSDFNFVTPCVTKTKGGKNFLKRFHLTFEFYLRKTCSSF